VKTTEWQSFINTNDNNYDWAKISLPKSSAYKDKELRDFVHEDLKRGHLIPPQTLIKEFSDIRNFLAANASGITRDTAIVTEMARVLFCKAYDELSKTSQESVDFQIPLDHSPTKVKVRLQEIFEKVKRSKMGFFDPHEEILLDENSLYYVVSALQKYEITKAGRDAMGEAFETLIGPTLRGEEGQFFTPRNVVRLMIRMVNPKPYESLIDPACGSGGFLVVSLDHVWKSLERTAKSTGEDFDELQKPKREAVQHFVGIDKDAFLAQLARMYIVIMSGDSAQVFCENSLASPESWSPETRSKVQLGSFDIVVTNPPFGSRIPVRGERILSQYNLGYLWKAKKKGAEVEYIQTNKLKQFESPQILFLERCLDLLREGGRMAIVLPEGILGNVVTGYVRKFIRGKAEIVAIVDCPLETFLPSTPTKVCILVLQKRERPKEGPVFMAIAQKCGHDRRGVPLMRPDGTVDDDFPLVGDAFDEFRGKHDVSF